MLAICLAFSAVAAAGPSDRWLSLAQGAWDPDTKLRYLNEAVAAEPSSWIPWAMRAEAYLARRAYTVAIRDASRATKLNPREWRPWSILAEARLHLGQNKQAAQAATQAIAMKPGEASPHAIRAEAYLRLGNMRQAADDASTALYIKPLNPQALRTRVDARLAMGQYARALDDLNALLGFNNADVFALRRRARAFAALGRLDEALRDCDALAANDPRSTDPLLLKADVLNSVGKHLDAAAAIQAAIQQHQQNPMLWVALGETYARAGRKADALHAFNAALKLNPSDAQALAARAELRRTQRDYDAALTDATAALELDPHSAFARVTRAAVHAEREDWAAAIKDLNAALADEPGYRDALRLRARVYRMTHEWDLAIRDAKRLIAATRTPKGRAKAYIDLGLAHAAKGQYRTAVRVLNRAVELAPGLAETYFARANAHRMNGEPAKGLPDCDKGIKLMPDSAYGRLLRGVCYFQMEDMAKASADLAAAVRLDKRQEWIAWIQAFRAETFRQQKRYRESIAAATIALGSRPKLAHPMAYVVRGASRRASGDSPGAVRDTTAAIRLRPDLAIAYAERGAAYRALHEYAKAIDDCDQAIALLPMLDLAYYERGHAALAQYRGHEAPTQASVAALKAIMTGMGGPDVPFELARSAPEPAAPVPFPTPLPTPSRPYTPEPVDTEADKSDTHPLDRAASDFRMLLRMGYKPRESAAGLAACLHEMARFEEAIAACNAGLAKHAKDARLLCARAAAKYAMGHAAAGLADARAAVAAEPQSGEAALTLAYGLALARRWPEAAAACGRALAARPDTYTAARATLLRFAAQAHAATADAALASLRQRLQARGRDATAWPSPIATALAAGENLRTFAERVATASEEHIARRRLSQASYYFGAAALAAGRRIQARAAFQRAVSLDTPQVIEHTLAARELRR